MYIVNKDKNLFNADENRTTSHLQFNKDTRSFQNTNVYYKRELSK